MRREHRGLSRPGVDLSEVDLLHALEAAENEGAVWTLRGSEDLNANLVRFEAGGGVETHVNEEVDVLLVGVGGSASVNVEGEDYKLRAGTAVFAPKGSRRSVTIGPEGLSYLSVHRRRGRPGIGSRPRREDAEENGGS